MRKKLFTCLLLSAPAVAAALEGSVQNQAGEPVAGATVEWRGGRQSVTTDANGRFTLAVDRAAELHVVAPLHAHRVLEIAGDSDSTLLITLQSTIMEIVDVVGLPVHGSNIEAAQPITVLGGDELARRQTSGLGETLKFEPGVHSTYYGPVASSPIIRGLDGPRVLITQNGLDAGDASRIGPDHVATGEAATAEQIEVLRGPATLFYGSGAIGGVVNVVDERVPTSADTYGSVILSHYTGANQNEAAAALNTGGGQFALHLDGVWRNGGDYDIPGFADADHAEHAGEDPEHDLEVAGTLPNSAIDSSAFNLGGSYLFDSGYVGLSYGRLQRLNGVPGHGHAEEEPEESEAHPGELAVQSDLTQDRWQLLSEIDLSGGFLSALHLRAGYTDYRHVELEREAVDAAAGEFPAPVPSTVFSNETWQGRVDLLHEHNAGWHGALSLEAKRSEFAAVGTEAFTPASLTKSAAVALLEERHIGSLLWQLGARVERVSLTADAFAGDRDQYEFTPLSASLGTTWNFASGYNATAVVTRAERAPSAAELFSQGAHLATRSYELGALYSLEAEADEWHVERNAADPATETSSNLDIGLRKFEGDFGFILNGFYNRIHDFYYLHATGISSATVHAEDEHEGEGEGEGDDHGHAEALPVYQFQTADVTLTGFEAEFIWRLAAPWRTTLWLDATRAEFDSGGTLPRIPPMRLGAQLIYEQGPLFAQLDVVHHFEQDRVAQLETSTPSYAMVDAELSYSWSMGRTELTLYTKGQNLLDQEARVHTSFLKTMAPLPGRGFTLGIRGSF